MITPRPQQQAALDALDETLDDADRAQVLMPCGTGKTLVGRWLAEQRASRLTVVLVPSLALVAQTLAEWRAAPGWRFDALIVCSDSTTADGTRERTSLDGADVPAPYWSAHRALVTTSAHRVADVLRSARPDRPLVVFSTYHSAPVVAAASAATGTRWDLVIADEAHHLAGQPRAEFRVVVGDDFPADKRVFMTATQVVVDPAAPLPGWDDWTTPLSMNDVAVFGPVAYRLDFAAAIAQDLLADYEVVIYEAPGEATPDPVAALLTAAQRGLTRVLTFHGRVAKAEAFAAAVNGVTLPDGRTVVARAVAGTEPAGRRARKLQLLNDPDPGTLVVISSARCLTEGVDLPAVDGVLFADPKNSDVDIIQSIGRVLRRAPGKTCGQILLPVCFTRGLDEDTILSTSTFAAVWRILRGLRALDSRLAAEFASLDRSRSRRGVHNGSRRPSRVTFELPSPDATDALIARLVDAAAPAWDQFFTELEAYVGEHGHSRPPAGHRLHAWCERQRRAHRHGMLLADRAAALRSLPGWTWDLDEQKWTEQWATVVAAAGDRLDLDNAELMSRPIPHRNTRVGIKTLGQWCAHQRILRRRGDLAPWRRERCEQIPGWTWSALTPVDATCLDLLAEYVAWKNDANVPVGYVDDDQPVGQWLQAARRHRATDTLAQAILDELEIVTPPPTAPGALRWNRQETVWSLGLEALRTFVWREGHCRIPDQHVEHLPDTDVALSVWCRRQRHAHRYGNLSASRVAALEAVQGWRWEIQPTPRIAIDIGDSRHGTRTGYVKGCKCEACTEANRVAYMARTERTRAGGPSTDLISASRARGRLRILQGQGATQKGLARAADLNVKTVTGILDGTTTRILPDTEQAVLALTIDQALAATAPGTTISAAPTWELINDLRRTRLAEELDRPRTRDGLEPATEQEPSDGIQRCQGRRTSRCPRRRRTSASAVASPGSSA